ncbi:MAG: hypothetical protein V7L00_07130 [Nostoc sp.]
MKECQKLGVFSELLSLHQAELMEDWELPRDNQTLQKTSPLE